MRQYSERPRLCQPSGWRTVYQRPGALLAGWLWSAAYLAFPLECQLCLDPGHDELDLCAECLRDLPRNAPACARCALPLPAATGLCGACSCNLPAFDAAFAAFGYEFPLDVLVQRLKYRGHLGHARLLGTLLGRQASARRSGIDALVPVPLHRAREATRGFNQALEIGRYAASATGLPLLPHVLVRTRATAAQARLGALQRRANVAGAFRADRSVAGQRLALVDDVLTTGHTVEAATRALRAAGAAYVEVWVVARAAPPRTQR